MANSSANTFHMRTLPNGLQILGQSMPDMESVATAFYVRTGSRDEHSPDIYGISHFLEHMVFKGTNTRTADDITLAFNRMGAEFNAYTSFEETVFHARTLSEEAPAAIELLADMMRPVLQEDDFTREREVILSEISRGEDNPSQVASRRFFQTYFSGISLDHDVIGTTESIRAMRVEQMRAYHSQRYAANNLILSVAGKIDWDKTVALAEQICGSWSTGVSGRTTEPFLTKPCLKHIAKDLQQQYIILGYPFPSEQSKDYYAATLGADILGDGSGSRMFWNITHQGLAEAAVTQFYPFDGLGMMLAFLVTPPENAQRVLDLTYHEIDSVEQDGVHEEELQRAKAKFIGQMALEEESTMRRMLNLPHSWLIDGRLKTIDEEMSEVEAVTTENINAVFKKWPSAGHTVLVTIGPNDGLTLR